MYILNYNIPDHTLRWMMYQKGHLEYREFIAPSNVTSTYGKRSADEFEDLCFVSIHEVLDKTKGATRIKGVTFRRTIE